VDAKLAGIIPASPSVGYWDAAYCRGPGSGLLPPAATDSGAAAGSTATGGGAGVPAVRAILTLGGDGTVLYASWLFQGPVVPPLVPFHFGSLGAFFSSSPFF
jgi:hypothetical protein